ncbi:cupin domain-containing protein [Streptomyces sp. NPDC014861]|uniref:cupin domain-containing protein n=1 Tax=Streptomyces sp. NPDC014861 TaxID=3364923 RepID=UPI0036F5D97B
MTVPIPRIDLFGSLLHLDPSGRMRVEQPVADTELERDGWLFMAAHAETDDDVHGDHWEIHTEADELVACLTGGIRVILRPERPGEGEEVIALGAGAAVIVPRGRWHRLALDVPSDMLAVTLPRGTREERWTEAEG